MGRIHQRCNGTASLSPSQAKPSSIEKELASKQVPTIDPSAIIPRGNHCLHRLWWGFFGPGHCLGVLLLEEKSVSCFQLRKKCQCKTKKREKILEISWEFWSRLLAHRKTSKFFQFSIFTGKLHNFTLKFHFWVFPRSKGLCENGHFWRRNIQFFTWEIPEIWAKLFSIQYAGNGRRLWFSWMLYDGNFGFDSVHSLAILIPQVPFFETCCAMCRPSSSILPARRAERGSAAGTEKKHICHKWFRRSSVGLYLTAKRLTCRNNQSFSVCGSNLPNITEGTFAVRSLVP